MNRAVRDQVKRSGGWRIIAEIDFNVVISRHALKLSAPEVVKCLTVARVQQSCVTSLPLSSIACLIGFGVATVVKPSFAGGIDKSFVDEDLSAFRMIDRHQPDVVVVISFPKFGGDAYVVVSHRAAQVDRDGSCTTLQSLRSSRNQAC